MMPSSTNFRFGEIVLVSFPFTDQTQRKRRPAAVVSSAAYHRERSDVILAALTNQVRATFGEAPLTQWKQAGLPVLCSIKPVIFTFEKDLVLKKLGRLQQKDRLNLRKLLDQILGDEKEAQR